MSEKTLLLKEMSESEFNNFTKLSKSNYINDKMKANGLSLEVATKIADEDFARYLPEGYTSPGNFLFTLLDENEKNVGHLWYVVRGNDNNRKAFIADIFLHENARGKGHGRKAMTLLEDHVKSQGLKHIGLHVFGFNETAIGLYKSLNYVTTDLMMEKTL